MRMHGFPGWSLLIAHQKICWLESLLSKQTTLTPNLKRPPQHSCWCFSGTLWNHNLGYQLEANRNHGLHILQVITQHFVDWATVKVSRPLNTMPLDKLLKKSLPQTWYPPLQSLTHTCALLYNMRNVHLATPNTEIIKTHAMQRAHLQVQKENKTNMEQNSTPWNGNVYWHVLYLYYLYNKLLYIYLCVTSLEMNHKKLPPPHANWKKLLTINWQWF